MQIHEITYRKLSEGVVGDTLKSAVAGVIGQDPAGQAAKAAKGLGAQGYGPGGTALPSTKWEDKLARVIQDPAVKQYISTTTAGWNNFWQQKQKEITKQSPATQPISVPPTKSVAGTTSSADWRQTQLKGVGANIPKEPAPAVAPASASAVAATTAQVRPKYGQPISTATPITLGGKRLDPKNPNDAKVLATMKAQGKLQEAPAEYTTPGGIVVPGNTKTDKIIPPSAPQSAPSTPVSPQYTSIFVDWTDQILASRDPVTGRAINMDDVRKLPGLGEKLKAALDNVTKTAGTAQVNYNIGEYLKLAVAGVQSLSQMYKNKAPQEQTAALGLATQAEPAVKSNLVAAGINPASLKVIGSQAKSAKARSTGNPEADAFLKTGGFQL